MIGSLIQLSQTLRKWEIKISPFSTATTRVVCLNFLLSQISDHDRLAYPTVANVKKWEIKISLFLRRPLGWFA
ncbi:hypothetical protein RO09_00420 [Streptococcus sobrinus]|nr:hypothetical protein RO09_00420 [Streptococcus sobrinus]